MIFLPAWIFSLIGSFMALVGQGAKTAIQRKKAKRKREILKAAKQHEQEKTRLEKLRKIQDRLNDLYVPVAPNPYEDDND